MTQETLKTFDKINRDLRDKFAGQAMQGLCVNVGRNSYHQDKPDELAKDSYKIADAMMEARKR